MKKIFSLLAVGVFMLGLSSCDNKTKEKVLNGGIISGSSSYLTCSPAASMTMLYKVAFVGAGAGSVSYAGAPALKSARRASGSDDGAGLGTPNADGTYTMDDDELGMTVKLNFKKGANTVYMDMSNLMSGTGLCLYSAELLSATKTIFTGESVPSSFPQYIPALWVRAVDSAPIAWYPINNQPELLALETGFNAWITGSSAFPDTIINTVNGTVVGAVVNLSMTTSMTSGCPTNAAPQAMSGSGTITFEDGAVWTVTCALSIGSEGPIGGTQSFTSTTGESGTLTFNTDGSMDGVMASSGVNIATIHINADGTGTYTDLTTGTEYDITGALPE